MKEVVINSWEDLQKNISKIVVAINKDPNLKLAAATNPLLAAEELGYKINIDVIDQIEERIRFKPADIPKLTELKNLIFNLAGKKFDIRSEGELNKVLFDDLKIESYNEKGCLIRKQIRKRKKGDNEDDLVTYQGLHPIIEPLIKFRQLDSSVAGFSNRDEYEKIRQGNYGERSNIQLMINFKKDKK